MGEHSSIIIETGEGESIPPRDPKAQRLRSLANIIATTAALVTAVGALFKPQDLTVSKASYDELKQAIEANNAADIKMHDDLIALRSYIEGQRSATSPPLPPFDASAPPQIVIPKKKSAAPISTGTNPASSAMLLQADPPTLHPRPEEQKLPDFEEMTKSAK